MPVHDVPRHEWPEFFDRFSRRHRAWLATVEQPGRATSSEAKPLGAVTPERAGQRVSAILISFAADSGSGAVRVENPALVRLHATPDGADRALEIMDDRGACTRVEFRAAVRSELLDGVAPGELA